MDDRFPKDRSKRGRLTQGGCLSQLTERVMLVRRHVAIGIFLGQRLRASRKSMSWCLPRASLMEMTLLKWVRT